MATIWLRLSTSAKETYLPISAFWIDENDVEQVTFFQDFAEAMGFAREKVGGVYRINEGSKVLWD